MKIFNNFDTELKHNELREAIELHGYDGVILVVRSRYYWIIKGIIPLIGTFIGNVVVISLAFYINSQGVSYLYWIIIGILTLLNIMFFYYLIMIFIDYKMDFTIVTREGVSTYKQKGLFMNNVKNLPASKIRSVQSKRVGILGNILGYGYILLVTDGTVAVNDDDLAKGAGMIKLTYVDRPNLMRKRILDLTMGSNEIVYFNLKDYA